VAVVSESLESLDLSNNALSDLSALQNSLVACKRLTTLLLDGNPLCAAAHYKMKLLENHHLKVLDNAHIKPYLRAKVHRENTPPARARATHFQC
jgi:Leucine-rich repeat (LRR) protein